MYNEWHAKLKPGFFYVGDQKWYLFVDKQTAMLEDVIFFEYELPQTPSSIREASYGAKTPASSDIKIDGKKIAFRSPAMYDVLTDEIEIVYAIRSVVAGKIRQVAQSPVTLNANNSSRRIFLSPAPVSGAPVIFTDEHLRPHLMNDYTHPEFDVDFDTGEVVFFGMERNYLWNASFTSWRNGLPVGWAMNVDPITKPLLLREGYLTDSACLLGDLNPPPNPWDSTNYLAQHFAIPENEETFALSFYMKDWRDADTEYENDAQIEAGLFWVDSQGRYLDHTGTVIATTMSGLIQSMSNLYLSDLFDPGDEWSRASMVVGPEGEAFDGPLSSERPSGAESMVLVMRAIGTPIVSNIQVEAAPEASDFVYVPVSGVFEYEGGDGDYCETGADLNPANNARITGLMTIALDPSADVEPEMY